MMLTKDMSRQISERIRQAIDDAIVKKDVSARRASIDVVGHDGLVRDIRAGRMPSVDRLIALMTYLDMVDWNKQPVEGMLQAFAEAAAEHVEPSIDGSAEALRHGFLPIPFSRDDPAHSGSSPIAIARSWLLDQRLEPDALSFISPPDDAMSPSISPQELVLIDASARPSEAAEIFAYSYRGQLGLGWVVAPRSDRIVVFFERKFASPLVIAEKDYLLFRPLGRMIARFDSLPRPWIGNDDRLEMLHRAKALAFSE